MSGETKEVLDSNYGQNDVIINRLIDKMTLFDDNLMSLVFGQNIETTELLLRVIMERDIKVIDVRGQDELKNPVIGGRCITLDVHAIDVDGRHIDIEVQINALIRQGYRYREIAVVTGAVEAYQMYNIRFL